MKNKLLDLRFLSTVGGSGTNFPTIAADNIIFFPTIDAPVVWFSLKAVRRKNTLVLKFRSN